MEGAFVEAFDIHAGGAAAAVAIPPALSGRAAVEQRRGPRIRTVFRIAKVVRDRAAGLWRVRNISDFGMMLLTRSRVVRGERLAIALSNHVTIDGRVVWAKGDACGIAFEKPIDSAATLTALVLEQREPGYRPPRVETDIRACLYDEAGVRSITVGDVSQQGIGFSHKASVEPGQRVRVLFEHGLERRGVVRWADERRAGLELFEPLSCEELETLLAS
jgi:hypothetical protein